MVIITCQQSTKADADLLVPYKGLFLMGKVRASGRELRPPVQQELDMAQFARRRFQVIPLIVSMLKKSRVHIGVMENLKSDKFHIRRQQCFL
jgi:hypothetical protein